MSDEEPVAPIRIILDGTMAERVRAAHGRVRERASAIGVEPPTLRDLLVWLVSRALAFEERGEPMAPDERLVADMTAREFSQLFGLGAFAASRELAAAAHRDAEEAAKRQAAALRAAGSLFEDARALVRHSAPIRIGDHAEIANLEKLLRDQLDGAGPGHVLLVAVALTDEGRNPYAPPVGSKTAN